MLVVAFHPELGDDTRLHERFLATVRGSPGAIPARRPLDGRRWQAISTATCASSLIDDVLGAAIAFVDAVGHQTPAIWAAMASPRISGSELIFAYAELWLGSMWQSRKARDLQRDPRFALHSASPDPGPAGVATRSSAGASRSSLDEELLDADPRRQGRTRPVARLFAARSPSCPSSRCPIRPKFLVIEALARGARHDAGRAGDAGLTSRRSPRGGVRISFVISRHTVAEETEHSSQAQLPQSALCGLSSRVAIVATCTSLGRDARRSRSQGYADVDLGAGAVHGARRRRLRHALFALARRHARWLAVVADAGDGAARGQAARASPAGAPCGGASRRRARPERLGRLATLADMAAGCCGGPRSLELGRAAPEADSAGPFRATDASASDPASSR